MPFMNAAVVATCVTEQHAGPPLGPLQPAHDAERHQLVELARVASHLPSGEDAASGVGVLRKVGTLGGEDSSGGPGGESDGGGGRRRRCGRVGSQGEGDLGGASESGRGEGSGEGGGESDDGEAGDDEGGEVGVMAARVMAARVVGSETASRFVIAVLAACLGLRSRVHSRPALARPAERIPFSRRQGSSTASTARGAGGGGNWGDGYGKCETGTELGQTSNLAPPESCD